jgi:hypothetical protein
MSKTWVGVIAFVAGGLVGAYLTKLYAISTIKGDVDAGLSKIGLGGGAVQGLIDNTVIPAVVG